MTALEFRNRKSDIEHRLSELFGERNALFNEQLALIRRDLADLGITIGSEVTCETCSYSRSCTFNGVHVNAVDRIYLEFVYTEGQTLSGVFAMKLPCHIDTSDDFLVITPDTTFQYQQFMSNYQ